jgi:putative colanic acid biosynthesis acetyltransferase WcaF
MIHLSQFNNDSFDRGAPAWKEGLWWVVRSLLFAPWFPLPSVLKVAALRAFGAAVGDRVVIRSRVNITFPWNLTIGDQVWIGDEVMILSLDRVTIGSNVCLSQRALLCTGSHDFAKESFDLVTGPITISEGCWVGASAFVGPGVDFGPGSRCLAGAVVVKDVAAGTTVRGVPASEVLSA